MLTKKTERIILICPCTILFYRYANEFEGSHWNSIRKGMALGLLIGWLFFTMYLIYASSFVFGLVLMHYEGGDESIISDILVVSRLSDRLYVSLSLFRLRFPLASAFLWLVLLVLSYKHAPKVKQRQHPYFDSLTRL